MMRRLSLVLCIALLTTPFAFSQQPVSLVLQPGTVQSHAAASSGSVASLGNAFSSNNLKGNSIIVVFANGNTNNPAAPISDTNSNVYFKAVQFGNLNFEAEIWYATNIAAGVNTVTVTPGGSAASIASEVYEVAGLLALSPQVLDQFNSNLGTSTALSTLVVTPTLPNELAFAAFAVGTAAQTITVAAPYTNDSGQQNPTTPAGLFSFVSASTPTTLSSTTATATITSEPWAAGIATFRTVSVPVQGQFTQFGTWNVRVTGNIGAIFDGATAAAVPVNALYVGGNGSGNLTGIVACDNSAVISMSTATTTQMIAISGSAGRTYICSVDLVAAGADNVTLISGSGTNCASNVAAIIGGTTAATGWNFAANGGLAKGSGLGMIYKTATTNNEVCVVTSAAVQLSGSITYTQF
jgi:hypothetical protein